MKKGRMVGTHLGGRKAEENKPRGGETEKGEAPWVWNGEWLHTDARLAQAEKIERCVAMEATARRRGT